MRQYFCIKATAIVLFQVFLWQGPISAQLHQTDQGDATLNYFIRTATESIPIVNPVSGIYPKDEILYCEGDSEAAQANNHAAEMMAKGEFEKAKDDLELSLKHAPLFLPFQYNLGLCYYHLNDRRRSRLHLGKAQMIVPEYYLTDIQLGHLEQLEGKDDPAILHFRDALRKNPKHLNALVLVGNIFFRRHQNEMASKYYEAVLKIDPRFPNALLGRAKVMYERNEIFKAYNILEMINLDSEYDKSLHYYYAESAYRLQDYKKALDQYTKLLEFKSDKFFVTTSLTLIEHKQELARRFVTQFEVK
jgi:tetratricopeptide (TPR) repeat protein